MGLKKDIIKGIEPQAAIRMFIIENTINFQELKKIKRIESIQEKYKLLLLEQKNNIAKFTCEIIKTKYLNNEKFIDHIYSYSLLSTSESNNNYIEKLIEYLTLNSNDQIFIKKICEVIFDIIEYEIRTNNKDNYIIASYLSIIINIGIKTSKSTNKSDNDKNTSLHLVEFITSNLIAISNVNNIEIRVALVYYLSKISNNYNTNLYKILSRFGQSLLEHIFSKYFLDKKNSDIAFLFLSEHLSKFISGSAYLAEMGNSVLQTQMLKKPIHFLIFIEKYLNEIITNINDMKTMTIHIAFLLKKACEINKQEIIEKLQIISINHLNNFKKFSNSDFIQQSEIMIEILSTAHSKQIRESINLITCLFNKEQNTNNLVHINKNKHTRKNVGLNINKINKFSPFKEILLLAK